MRQDVPMRFPIKGVVEDVPFTQIPDGFTPRALNVWPFDRNDEKMRGGKRAGIRRLVRNPVDGIDEAIIKMKQVALASSAFINPGGFFTDPDFNQEGWIDPTSPVFPIDETFNYTAGGNLKDESTWTGDWVWSKSSLQSGSDNFQISTPTGAVRAFTGTEGDSPHFVLYKMVAGSSLTTLPSKTKVAVGEVRFSWDTRQVITGSSLNRGRANVTMGLFHTDADSNPQLSGIRAGLIYSKTTASETLTLDVNDGAYTSGGSPLFNDSITPTAKFTSTGTLTLRLDFVNNTVRAFYTDDSDGLLIDSGTVVKDLSTLTITSPPQFTLEHTRAKTNAGDTAPADSFIGNFRVYEED